MADVVAEAVSEAEVVPEVATATEEQVSIQDILRIYVTREEFNTYKVVMRNALEGSLIEAQQYSEAVSNLVYISASIIGVISIVGLVIGHTLCNKGLFRI